MRLPRFSKKAHGLKTVLGCGVSLGASLGSVMLLGGCETKGLIDPSEMGRYRNEPLSLPILSQVDPRYEEVETEFSMATDPTAADRQPDTSDYKISRNDLLSIQLSDIVAQGQETLKNTRVSESGNISLPLLEPIHAEGKTEIELEREIIAAYRNAGQVQNAQVSVTVAEARGRAFSIMGSVIAPGEYAIVDSDFRVYNALVLARNVSTPLVDTLYIIRRIDNRSSRNTTSAPAQPGTGPSVPSTGPAKDDLAPQGRANENGTGDEVISANHVVHLDADPSSAVAAADDLAPAPSGTMSDAGATTRGTGSSGFSGFNDPAPASSVRVIRIPLAPLRKGDLNYNIPIRPHDLLIVQDPAVGVYYMGGHVGHPGVYTFNGQKITLKQAVIAASMLDGIAIPQRTDIVRRIRPDHEVFVRVDLDKIFSGAQPDLYLKADDQIMVGTNALAPFLAAARGAFRLTYGFGFLYDRNYAYSTNNGVAR